MDDLPPLPREAAGYMRGCNEALAEGDLLFTADQMREYARAAIQQERERCAQIAEDMDYGMGAIAAALRNPK